MLISGLGFALAFDSRDGCPVTVSGKLGDRRTGGFVGGTIRCVEFHSRLFLGRAVTGPPTSIL